MMTATSAGWEVTPLLTIGVSDQLNYRIPGIPDGLAAFPEGESQLRILVNHEIRDDRGYAYPLSNGTVLTGARISYLVADRQHMHIGSGGVAYDRIFDRLGELVTAPVQLHEDTASDLSRGLHLLCSSYGVHKETFGFANDIVLTGEETSNGQACVLDVRKNTLYIAPMLGRAAFENICPMEQYNSDKVVLLISDDRHGAPLYLYIGQKEEAAYHNAPEFLTANGLASGRLYVWVSGKPGEKDPTGFRGTGEIRNGTFVSIQHFDAALSGTTGYDALGFAGQQVQDSLCAAAGQFRFSRPEDIARDPDDPTRAVMTSTGSSRLFKDVETWGTTYLVDLEAEALQKWLPLPLEQIDSLPAILTILYDGNDAGNGQFQGPDYGLRSPDNTEWASDGYIYIQEDAARAGFGLESGMEASIFQLDPDNGKMIRVAVMDRSALPQGQTDARPDTIGDWESSGILDITPLLPEQGTTLLLTVQAHSISDGGIGGITDLVQGGQLLLLRTTKE